jgi:hypothetical protein
MFSVSISISLGLSLVLTLSGFIVIRTPQVSSQAAARASLWSGSGQIRA